MNYSSQLQTITIAQLICRTFSHTLSEPINWPINWQAEAVTIRNDIRINLNVEDDYGKRKNVKEKDRSQAATKKLQTEYAKTKATRRYEPRAV